MKNNTLNIEHVNTNFGRVEKWFNNKSIGTASVSPL